MGTFCSNPLEYLIQEHGDDVGKFIVAEKTKQYFEQKYPEMKKQLGSKVDQFNQQTLTKIDQQSKTSVGTLTGKINEFKSGQSSAITTFETASGKKFDDMVGMGTLNTQIEQIKKTSEDKLKTLKGQVLSQADKGAQGQKKLIQSQKPSIPAYDNMPQCLKDKVWQQGQKKFGGEIQKKKKETEQLLKNATDFQKLKTKAGGEIPTDQVKQLTGKFQTTFNTAKTTIQSASSASSLGKMFG